MRGNLFGLLILAGVGYGGYWLGLKKSSRDGPMTEKEAKENGSGIDLTAAYLGFVAGMCLGLILNMNKDRRDKEKIRRHLERALDEVDD